MEDEDEDEVNVLSDANSRSISFLLIFYGASRGARTATRIVGKGRVEWLCLGSRSMAICVGPPHASVLVVVRPTRAVCWHHHKLRLSIQRNCLYGVMAARFKSASSRGPHYSSDEAAIILARRVEDDWWRALYNASRSLFAVAVCVTEIRVVISGEIEQQSV